MNKKEFTLTVAQVMFPAISKEDLADIIGNRSVIDFINDPAIHTSDTQKDAVAALVAYYEEAQKHMPETGVKMYEVTSSNVHAIGYDTRLNALIVEFNSGTKYSYKDVPYDIYRSLRMADSVGRALGPIKAKYEATKIT